MYEYIIKGDVPPDAIVVPGEDIDPSKLILADHRPNSGNCGSERSKAPERCLSIFREMRGENAELVDPIPPKPTFADHVRRVCGRFTARLVRLWVWNVSYPVRMWLHFRIYREKDLPDGRQALRAMLRDAFRTAGVTDLDLPYSVSPDEGKENSGFAAKPDRCALFFNRKRLTGS